MIKWSDEALEAAAKAWLNYRNAPTNEELLLTILNAAAEAQYKYQAKERNERLAERDRQEKINE